MGDVSAVNSISTTSVVDNGLSRSVRLCNKPQREGEREGEKEREGERGRLLQKEGGGGREGITKGGMDGWNDEDMDGRYY